MTGVEAKPSLLSHPALTVTNYLGVLEKFRVWFQVKRHSSPVSFLVHNSSINNLVRGVLTRVLLYKGVPPVTPREGIYRERLARESKLILRQFSSTTCVSREQYVRDYCTGRRVLPYTKALLSLVAEPIQKRDADLKCFVKAEFINSTDKPDPDPRVISPRDPRYNIEVGRYLRVVEHRIYGAIARMFRSPTVLKGYNAEQIGGIFSEKWASFSKPVAVGLDASRFDQHVSYQALAWEHSIYNGIFRSAELEKLLRWQLRNQCRGYCYDGKLKYQTVGTRMSGDVNTGLGNCLIMCSLVHSYLRELGVKGSLANNGDDCVVIIESRDLPRFSAGLEDWFHEMGFVMKVEKPVYILEEIEFCQTHPVFDGEKYIMVRNLRTGLAKDCCSLKLLDDPTICYDWFRAVGLGGLSLTGGIPIYQSFYSSFLRHAGVKPDRCRQNSLRRNKEVGYLSGGLQWLSSGMTRSIVEPTQMARYSFWLAFGVTPDMQVLIEEHYDNLAVGAGIDRETSYLPDWFVC